MQQPISLYFAVGVLGASLALAPSSGLGRLDGSAAGLSEPLRRCRARLGRSLRA